MTESLPVGERLLPLPTWTGRGGDRARTVADIDRWSSSPALSRVVSASGGRSWLVPAVDGAKHLEELAAFADQWDGRSGRERDQAEPVETDPELTAQLADAAVPLGLAEREVPCRRDVDAVVMTGGMVRAQFVKPRAVDELLRGGLTTTEVVFLGGFRAFSTQEHDLAARLGSRATDEFMSMQEGIQRVFGPFGDGTDIASGGTGHADWRTVTWRRDAHRFSVVAAPSSDPLRRRAHTADTFRFWASRADAVKRVLVVTTPVYVPYQAAVAVEVLGVEYGMAVETVGVAASASDLGELTQVFRPQHQLQELRSALRAMRSLRRVLTTSAD